MDSDYAPPKGCPADDRDYLVPLPGSYAYKLMTRGMVPLLGGTLQAATAAPPVCKDDNDLLKTQMQQEMFEFAKAMDGKAEDTWKALNATLNNVMLEGNVVTSLAVLPLEMILLYLLAAVVSLGFLIAALVVGI